VLGEPRAWLEDLDACAVACEDALERLRSETDAVGLGRLERELLLTAAVTRTACGEADGGGFDGEALASLLIAAAELSERTAVTLAETGDERLGACREACLAAAAAARRLAPLTLSNGF
jgi:hypothetical protein